MSEERRKEFIRKAKEIHGERYSYEFVEYVNSHTKVNILCSEHGSFYQLPYVHIGKQRSICPKCAKINSTNKSKKTLDEFIKESNLIHNYKYNYDKVVYKTNKIKVIVSCEKHGDFKVAPNSHLSGKTGCPNCFISRGEENIAKVLCDFGINFIRRHKFDDCFYKKKLEFDFYLPEQNICIEYDGEQHFKEVKFFNSNLKENKIRDGIKNKYCEDKGIKLIRISYFEKEIEKVLNEYLSTFKNIKKSKKYITKDYYYLSYAEAKEYMILNNPNVKSQKQFKKWKDSDIYYDKIPKNPYSVYKRSNEWVSWGDFLNSNNISGREIAKKYTSYENAKKWISENLNCSNLSISKWKEIHRNGEVPDFIPLNPNTYYSKFNRGWVSYIDFLGNNKIPTNEKEFVSYKEAKELIKKNRPDIKTQKEWQDNYKEFSEEFKIPCNPYRTYKQSNEWVSWKDFLNKS